MANQDTNYGNIFNPYNSNLERASSSTDGSVIPSTSGESIQTPTGTSSPTAGTPSTLASTSPIAPPASIQGNSLIDLYIETFIKSRNYQPKVQGIYLDGRTGYLEAQTGNIAGWDFTRDQLSSGSVYIQSTAERILMGAATAPLTGIGIFLGKDSADYEFRAGDPAGDYIHWNGSTLSVSGSIIAGSIDIGGADATSFHVSSAGNLWLGAATYDIATNPFAVSSAGVIRSISGTIGGWTLGATTLTGTGVTMSSTGDAYLAIGITPPTGVATGTGIFINKTGLFGLNANTQNFIISATNGNITAIAGTIGGFTIGSDYLRDTANSFGLASTVTVGDDVRFWAGDTFANRATAPFTVTESGAVTASAITITGGSISVSTLNGIIQQTNLNVADRGWSQTCAFSITNATTVAWGAGTFTSADGTAYSIGASNTGVMAAKNYIYLDTAVSTTAYQTTTTATTAVGVGKVLVAIAQNGTNEATYKVLQGQGGENIDAANIVTGSITANEIAASTITAAKMSVTTLSSMAADLGTITAGTITLDTAGYIRGGQTDFATGTGWFVGFSGGLHKLSIGTPTNYFTFDGTYVRIKGNLDLTSIFNNISYTVANLPVPPSTEGFLSPSAYEY